MADGANYNASEQNPSSGNVAAASAVATITGAAGVFSYIDAFEVTGAGATAASVIAVTVTGLVTGTQTYIMSIPAGVTAGVTPLIVQFPRPLQSSAVNTNIVVTAPSFGAGNTNACVNAHGYTL